MPRLLQTLRQTEGVPQPKHSEWQAAADFPISISVVKWRQEAIPAAPRAGIGLRLGARLVEEELPCRSPVHMSKRFVQ
jgi:hypothetical protein